LFLESIELYDFRNYQKGCFRFEPKGALIIGANGSGKTNLLEAIAYCGIGKSIRLHHDEQLLRHNCSSFSLRAKFSLDEGGSFHLHMSFGSKKKLFRLDNNPLRQLSFLIEKVKVIYCAPEDLLLVNGSPRTRRQYFDIAIAQIFPPYMGVLREYLKVIEQRNALLKTHASEAEKSIWDRRFYLSYKEVLRFRRRYLEVLNELFNAPEFRLIDYKLHINYQNASHLESPDHIDERGFLTALAALWDKEKHYQRSLVGAHLDDYEMSLDAMNLKSYASQGQKRIFVLILKLVQARLISKITGIKPILLLDDILAELDATHAQGVYEICEKDFQVIIAAPRKELSSVWQNLPIISLTKVV